MSPNIIIVDIAPFDVGSPRPRRLARSLANVGCVVYFGLARSGRSANPGRSGTWEDRSRVRVTNIDGPAPITSRAIWASIINVAIYAVGIARLTLRCLKTPAEVIFVENPVLLPVGALHSLLRNSQLIFDARERPESISLKGSLATWLARMEPLIYRMCRGRVSLLLTVCESHARDYRRLGFNQIDVIHNTPPLPSHVVAAPKPMNCLKLAYVGNLLPNRAIENVLEAIRLLKPSTRVELELIGPAAPEYRNLLEREITSHELATHVSLRGPIPSHSVMDVYSRSHVVLVLYGDSDRANDSMPNKLFEAMAAGRCVVVNQPQASSLVKSLGCGLSTSLDPPGLANAFRRLARSPDFVVEAGTRGRRATQDLYNWDRQVEPLLRKVSGYLSTAHVEDLGSGRTIG